MSEKLVETQTENIKPPIDAQKILDELDKIDTLLRHLKNVQDACIRLGKALIKEGQSELGRTLIANSFTHDQSKFRGIEWENIATGECEDKSQRNLAIKEHQVKNMHHPEFWGSIHDMPTIYVYEMVCDWYARSTEMGTDLRDWVENSATTRFGFTKRSGVWKDIKKSMDILLDKPFK